MKRSLLSLIPSFFTFAASRRRTQAVLKGQNLGFCSDSLSLPWCCPAGLDLGVDLLMHESLLGSLIMFWVTFHPQVKAYCFEKALKM